jgi:hypothetical protein
MLTGENDPVTGPARARELQNDFPNSKIVVIPGGGHMFGGFTRCLDQMIAKFLQGEPFHVSVPGFAAQVQLFRRAVADDFRLPSFSAPLRVGICFKRFSFPEQRCDATECGKCRHPKWQGERLFQE